MSPRTGIDSKNKHKEISSPLLNFILQKECGIQELDEPASPEWDEKKHLLGGIRIEGVFMAKFKKCLQNFNVCVYQLNDGSARVLFSG
jgi:hypothetical protein